MIFTKEDEKKQQRRTFPLARQDKFWSHFETSTSKKIFFGHILKHYH